MVRGFRPPSFRRRDSSEREPLADSPSPTSQAQRVGPDDLALDDAPVGRHMLLPSASYTQVIYDPTPIWARPRPAATPAPIAEPATATASDVSEPDAPEKATKPKPTRRARKPEASRTAADPPAAKTPRRSRTSRPPA